MEDSEDYVILYPEITITPSYLSGCYPCERRGFLSEKYKSFEMAN